MYVYICICTYMYMYIYVYVHIFVLHIYVCMHKFVSYIYMYVYIRITDICLHIYIYICLCINMYTYISEHIYICLYIFILRKRMYVFSGMFTNKYICEYTYIYVYMTYICVNNINVYITRTFVNISPRPYIRIPVTLSLFKYFFCAHAFSHFLSLSRAHALIFTRTRVLYFCLLFALSLLKCLLCLNPKS